MEENCGTVVLLFPDSKKKTVSSSFNESGVGKEKLKT